MGFYTTRRDLFGTVAASGVTSEVVWIGDAEALTLQIVGSPSTTSIQISNDNGRDVAITNWTTIQSIVTADVYYFQPGARWMRALRSETTAANLTQQIRTS